MAPRPPLNDDQINTRKPVIRRRQTIRPYDEGDPIAGELLEPSNTQTFRENLKDASSSAFRGGAAGAAAMGKQAESGFQRSALVYCIYFCTS